jgi:polar amino acid transport system substrate-binding protein
MRNRHGSRLLWILLVLVLLATACGDEAEPTTTSPPATTATTEGPQFNLVKDGVLTVAVADFPVQGFWEGDDPIHPEGGIEAMLAEHIADELGLEIEFVKVNFGALIGQQFVDFDIFLDQVSITEERKELFDFSDGYYSSGLGLAVMEGTSLDTWEDLQSLVLGGCAGCNSFNYIVEVIQPTADPRAFEVDIDKYTALEAGQIGGAIGDLPYIIAEVNNRAGSGMVVGCRFPEVVYSGVVIRQDAGITEAVQAVVAEALDDETIAALLEEWVFPTLGGVDPMSVPECPAPPS